eukprot:1582184-Pleurochrysis_carterae.AAC.1
MQEVIRAAVMEVERARNGRDEADAPERTSGAESADRGKNRGEVERRPPSSAGSAPPTATAAR